MKSIIRCLLYMIVVGIPMLLGSCSSLTKSQTQSINQYYSTLNNFTDYPKALNRSMAKIEFNRLQLYPETYDVDSLMIESLVKSFQGYRENMKVSRDLELAMSELDNYFKDYFLLIPNGFKSLKLLENTSVAVGSVFGVGKIISAAFVNANEIKITPKRALRIKEHILKGEPILRASAMKIRAFADSAITVHLSKENEYIKENYTLFLHALRSRPDSYELYSRYNAIFINHYNILYNTENLARQLLKVTDMLESSHRALMNNTSERIKLESDISAIHELYLQIVEMKNTLEILNSFKEPGVL